MVVEGYVSKLTVIKTLYSRSLFFRTSQRPLLQFLTTTFFLSLTKRLELPKHDHKDISRALTVRSSYCREK